MDVKKFCFRVLFYVLGLFVMAIGVTFASNSNLGMSPVNSIPAVLSAITNIEMGTCVIIVFSLFIVAQIVIKRREFRWINLGIDGYPTSLVFLGTVVSAVFVGVVMGPIQKFIIPPIRRICFGEAAQPST